MTSLNTIFKKPSPGIITQSISLIPKPQTLALITALALLFTACPADDETSPLAKLPGISITANPSPLTEENINGATLTLTLTNATYTDPIGEASQFTLTTHARDHRLDRHECNPQRRQ